MNLTIMILTYNSDNALEECLNSIKGNYPILVIENSARNEFKQKIEKKYQNLKCILTNKNLGFGRAMNLGLRMIDTKYVLTLGSNATGISSFSPKNNFKLNRFISYVPFGGDLELENYKNQ